MRENRERAFAWALIDFPDLGEAYPTVCEMVWSEVLGDELPAGLDYFLFACGARVECHLPARWLRKLLERDSLPELLSDRVTVDLARESARHDPGVLISGVEMIWRRRLKAIPYTPLLSKRETNYINRARHRALKLVEVKSFA
jgi:hypothetical protein